MQRAFEDDLRRRLPPAGWSVGPKARLSLPWPRYSAWSQYDIGVLNDDRLIALLELSLGDTNVPHALHNGELKLLGNCSGTGVSSQKPFSTERALTADDAAILERHLKSIPVRGLFFVGYERILNQPERAMWWETKGANFSGETRFWSALLAPEKKTTLRQVFQRLGEAGLHCWFYSARSEETGETSKYFPAGG
jgi:hypothetical protein